MTEQEAKELIKYINEEYFYYDKEGEFDEINEALDMAISALEEIHQYRALGTVEELQELKQRPKSRREFYQIGYEDGLRKAGEKQKEIEEIINMQLIAGKNNYKEVYKIVKVVQRH